MSLREKENSTFSVVDLMIFYRVRFAEPTTSIFGGPDMHVHEGSPVNLSCLVSQAVGQPEFFFWYHNGQVKTHFVCFKIQFDAHEAFFNTFFFIYLSVL